MPGSKFAQSPLWLDASPVLDSARGQLEIVIQRGLARFCNLAWLICFFSACSNDTSQVTRTLKDLGATSVSLSIKADPRVFVNLSYSNSSQRCFSLPGAYSTLNGVGLHPYPGGIVFGDPDNPDEGRCRMPGFSKLSDETIPPPNPDANTPTCLLSATPLPIGPSRPPDCTLR